MKDSARTVRGYLLVFTLGFICATCVYIALQRRAAPPEHLESKLTDGPAETAPPPPRPQTFQRRTPPLHSVSAPKLDSTTPDPLPTETAPPEPPQPEIIPIASTVRQAVPGFSASHGVTLVRGGGRISGSVHLHGTPPPERPLPLDPACSAVWHGPKTTRFYRVGKDHGLADVLVVLTSGLSPAAWAPPDEPFILSQTNCLFQPYISAVQTGQRIRLLNSEPLLHRLQIISSANGETNFTQMPGAARDLQFTNPEQMVKIKCDLHPWEFAYISAIEHPFFAVTDANGNFVMPSVPPGRYTIEAFHRKAGKQTQEITVEANRGATIQFTLEAGDNTLEARDEVVEGATPLPRRLQHKTSISKRVR